VVAQKAADRAASRGTPRPESDDAEEYELDRWHISATTCFDSGVRMRVTTVFIVLVFALSAVISAQTATSDEQQIRALIAKYDSGQTQGMGTKDRIFWSGALKRPVIGSEQGEEVPSDRGVSARVPGSQRNNTKPVRIEIARSGDLAYEFSNSTLSFDLKSGSKESFPTSLLRVWKKEDGQWKIAAMFARPHYQDP
jgi:hypothetical protein